MARAMGPVIIAVVEDVHQPDKQDKEEIGDECKELFKTGYPKSPEGC